MARPPYRGPRGRATRRRNSGCAARPVGYPPRSPEPRPARRGTDGKGDRAPRGLGARPRFPSGPRRAGAPHGTRTGSHGRCTGRPNGSPPACGWPRSAWPPGCRWPWPAAARPGPRGRCDRLVADDRPRPRPAAAPTAVAIETPPAVPARRPGDAGRDAGRRPRGRRGAGPAGAARPAAAGGPAAARRPGPGPRRQRPRGRRLGRRRGHAGDRRAPGRRPADDRRGGPGGVRSTVDEVKGGVQQTIDQAKGGVRQTVDDFKGEIGQAVEGVKGEVGQGVGQVVDRRSGVRQTVDEVKGQIAGQAQQAKDELGSSAQQLKGQLLNDIFGSEDLPPPRPAPVPAPAPAPAPLPLPLRCRRPRAEPGLESSPDDRERRGPRAGVADDRDRNAPGPRPYRPNGTGFPSVGRPGRRPPDREAPRPPRPAVPATQEPGTVTETTEAPPPSPLASPLADRGRPVRPADRRPRRRACRSCSARGPSAASCWPRSTGCTRRRSSSWTASPPPGPGRSSSAGSSSATATARPSSAARRRPSTARSWQLLTMRPDYGTLTLHGAAVDIERRADGSIDLADALAPILGGDDDEDDEGPRRTSPWRSTSGTLTLASPELAAPADGRAARHDPALHPGPADLGDRPGQPGGAVAERRRQYDSRPRGDRGRSSTIEGDRLAAGRRAGRRARPGRLRRHGRASGWPATT